MKKMKYIVVIIEEMEEMMMVDGKEIEGEVKSIEKMESEEGINIIMEKKRK